MAVGTGVQLTDPRELLEVYDPEGNPTGEAKTRGTVHREGDWHLAFFCWIARPGARDVEILLQHRAARKDVWPLRFDAKVEGFVCGNCATRDAFVIDNDVARTLDAILHAPVGEFTAPKEVLFEIRSLAGALRRNFLGYELKSFEVLAGVLAGASE